MASRTTTRRSWPRWLGVVGWSVLGLLGATLGAFVITITFGAVHGTEFCPQTFERRSYSYFEIPLLRVQITGERRNDLTGAVETFLTSEKYVHRAAGQAEWHPVRSSRGTRHGQIGDARILIEYLDSKGAGDDHRWVKWSEKHPAVAKLLWPAVQRLAEHELYVFLPDAFDLTKAIDDPKKFQPAIDRLVAEKLMFLARRLDERGEAAEAKRVKSEAEKLVPAT